MPCIHLVVVHNNLYIFDRSKHRTHALRRMLCQQIKVAWEFEMINGFYMSVSAKVPPLGVYLINESPRLAADSVEAEFQITRPVAGVRCFLRSQFDRVWQNCKYILFAIIT